MKGRKPGICALLLLTALLSACSRKEEAGEQAVIRASLFCDVEFWGYPAWEETEGTITGDITRRTGVALDVMQPTQEADTQLRLLLLNDELPEIISVTDSVTISQLVNSGKMWKLDEFLETYKPDSHLLTDFPEDTRTELIRRDGAWYAYPSHMNSEDARKHWNVSPYQEEVVRYNDNNVIMWNLALLEQAGLQTDALGTWEEVLGALEKVKELQLQVGAEWVDEEGHYRDILLQPQAKTALRFLNIAMREGYAEPGQLLLETRQTQQLLCSGRVLCFIGNAENTKVNFADWVSTGVILAPDGSRPVLGKNTRATTGWISTFISKSCKNPEAVASFLDYMTSGEGMALWNYGYEDTDYRVGEDGSFYKMDVSEERRKELGAWWMFYNTSWARSVQALSDDILQENEIVTAYGMHPQTVLYDSSLLNFPADLIQTGSAESRIERGIASWKDSQIVKVVLADSEENFEREYETLIQGLYEKGIEQLDRRRDEGYQANCREYGNYIQKVNRE
ncbi:MAG TPA: hypothetical protein DCZ91_18455 [Lachnospiraceae bacterium]|nr:hypothetical protein [Lachnospiraceae bacterium]